MPGPENNPMEVPDNAKILALLDEMKQAIWSRRPILGEIMNHHGQDTLYDYSQDFLDVNPTPGISERRGELILVAKDLLTARLGETVAQGVADQLTKLPMVSTADHHGPITHPFFLNSNIISAIPFHHAENTHLKYLVAFSFASISVNNTSFPRGIVFHNKENGEGNFIRLPILPDRLKMGVVYGVPAFTRDEIDRAKKQLGKKAMDIAPARAKKIADILETYFAAPDVLSAPDFASQITKINHRLWPTIFHAAPEAIGNERPHHRIPDLIYLEIETLVTELLLRHHFTSPNSLLSELLFGKNAQEDVRTHLNNIPGGFSIEKDWGSYFFWAVDAKFHRVQLWLKDGFLASRDGEHKIPFTAEGVSDALRAKKIFPSMMLCYIVVSLYYGMKCLGGFSQVNDLTMLKDAWGKFLAARGHTDEAKALEPIQTKELGGDGMVLAYMGRPNDGLVPATAINMIVEHSEGRYESYVELSKKITLAEAMSPLLPDIYAVLYSFPDRKPEFAALTAERILKALGMHERLMKKPA